MEFLFCYLSKQEIYIYIDVVSIHRYRSLPTMMTSASEKPGNVKRVHCGGEFWASKHHSDIRFAFKWNQEWPVLCQSGFKDIKQLKASERGAGVGVCGHSGWLMVQRDSAVPTHHHTAHACKPTPTAHQRFTGT